MMTHKTKLDINDTVWFMHKNKACCGKIKKIFYGKFISPADFKIHESEAYYVNDIKDRFEFSDLFSTKEELIDSL
ncbi:MAG: hypothetical protein J6S89_04170 [Paludibacteraceae bacterium]|nr:hypothetical protein [Paludibacteraceae bacterium]